MTVAVLERRYIYQPPEVNHLDCFKIREIPCRVNEEPLLCRVQCYSETCRCSSLRVTCGWHRLIFSSKKCGPSGSSEGSQESRLIRPNKFVCDLRSDVFDLRSDPKPQTPRQLEELKEQMAMEAQMGADTQRKAKQVRETIHTHAHARSLSLSRSLSLANTHSLPSMP